MNKKASQDLEQSALIFKHHDHPEIITDAKTRHSEKPDIFYDIIEKMYPNRRYLELFARKTRENWTPWGHEVA